jgi:predicted anti-sigma-YlaC factor YlaD
MKCDEWQQWVLERELPQAKEQEEWQEHLTACAHCRDWANALAEVDAILTSELGAGVDESVLHSRILRGVKRERRWMTGVPDMLEALGWNALAVLAMAGLLLWSDWQGWRLGLVAAGTLAGSLG